MHRVSATTSHIHFGVRCVTCRRSPAKETVLIRPADWSMSARVECDRSGDSHRGRSHKAGWLRSIDSGSRRRRVIDLSNGDSPSRVNRLSHPPKARAGPKWLRSLGISIPREAPIRAKNAKLTLEPVSRQSQCRRARLHGCGPSPMQSTPATCPDPEIDAAGPAIGVTEATWKQLARP